VIDVLSMSPLDEDIILDSVKKTNRVVIVDEDTPRCSMASEIAAVIADQAFDYLDAPVKRVTGPHTPVPYSRPLETAFIPDAAAVVSTTKKLLGLE
jgi:pyruvate dehydrogenase E1 component beta subunit